jgi:hypothetical protein
MLRFFALFLAPLFAHANFAADFSASLQKELFWFDSSRLLQTTEKIYLAQPNLLERWGVINSEAAASYNSILNTIILKPDVISRDAKGSLRISTVPELIQTKAHSFGVAISTIMHEIAHAEYDVFVERSYTPEDERLFLIVEREVLPWLQRNHPGLSRSEQNVASWEIFGYYRGDLIQQMLNDREEILSANGYFNKRCYFSPTMKEAAQQLTLEEFTKLLPIGKDFDESYGTRFRLEYVWAKGEDVELFWKNHPEPFRQEWQLAYFRHFRAHYAIPENKRVLLARMNKLLPKELVECRKNYWNSLKR